MANQELDNILEREYETITRNRTPSKAPGLLDMIRLPAEAPTIDESIQTRAPSLKPIMAQSSAPSPINQGYTPPTVPSTPNNKTESSIAGTIGTTALKLFTSGLGVM